MGFEQIFIFTGPTISPTKAAETLDATYLPPVKYGDVYRLCELYQPQVIGIIDGYFNQVPAVWHKEILWAIDQGISVFGAASMGALRAAELDQFGMTGCGKIYEAYQAGILPPFNNEAFEDDDEVAVVHSPAELGYLPVSDAMVNIRFSFAKALQHNIIDLEMCKQLTQIAKTFFYPDRQYARIFATAQQQGLTEAGLSKLQDWLKHNAVDQKQLDAINLLETIKNKPQNTPATRQRSDTLPFQHTAQWQTAMDEIDHSHTIESPTLDELRLQGEPYFEALGNALEAVFGGNSPVHTSLENLSSLHQSPDGLNAVFTEHWQRRENQSTADHLSPKQHTRILLKYLRHTGQLEGLEQKAKDKKNKLDQIRNMPKLSHLGEIDKLQLCDWYFTRQLGQEMPSQIEAYALEIGIHDLDTFYAMILRAYLYQDVK